MDPVPTQYIDRDGAALAYQVIGNGTADAVFFLEIVNHLDLQWTDPDIHANYERIGKFSRAAFLQPRGSGLSDQVSYVPTLEQHADDVLAVMDAVGMRQATLMGMITTCSAVALVAARAPERVKGLVLFDPVCQGSESPEELQGWTATERATYWAGWLHAFDHWGSGATIDMIDASLGTPYNRRLVGLLERCSTTPGVARSYVDWNMRQDFQEVLRAVSVPVRVVHMSSSALPEGAARYVAEIIPNGTLHVVPPFKPGTTMGQSFLPVIEHVEEMATGSSHSADADRFLGTVLFTDVVSSTELLELVGDTKYRQLRVDHERMVRLAVENAGGRLMTVTGDGTLSVFDSPTSAVRCAERICRDAQEAGINVRAGIHTGELERDGMNVTGLTVHIGARVGAAANAGEVLVSRTVRDLVAGSGLTFASRGEKQLKGVSGTWELFGVTRAAQPPENLPAEESMQTPMDKVILQAARRTPGLTRAAVRLGNAVERRRAKKQRT